MGGAIGAWAESTQTIYLNADWLSGATKEQIVAVLTEEFGHYLDSQFNRTDTKGDEGGSFGRILEGEGLSSQTVEMNSNSYPKVESREEVAAGSILDAQLSPFATRDFSSAIFDSSQPIMRCGCSTCMQQASSFDQSFKANKFSDFPPNNPGTLDASGTWSALPDDNPYINGLMTGSKWGETDPDDNGYVMLDYYFFDNETLPDGAYGYQFLQQEADAAINAMTAYSSVANISFTPTVNYSEANIAWASLDSIDSGDGILGYAYTPENGDFSGITTVNWENYSDAIGVIEGSIDPGSYYYLTFTHELGHALGLKHPHDLGDPYGVYPGVSSSGDGGDNGLNAGPWTVMTYNDSTANNGFSPTTDSYSGFLTGLGAFDIAAVQYLYGANLGANAGSDTYKMSDPNGFSCIWDNGGIDIIDASDLTASVTIDLRNATLQNSLGGGGFISRINNEFKGYTIAYDSTGSCIIENAIGGSAADILTGNSGNNILDGGAGIDTMVGGAGNDTYKVDVVGDVITEAASEGTDTVETALDYSIASLANLENITLTGASAVNATGNSAANALTGNSGNNILDGGAGTDTMAGGAGNDIYVVDSATDTITEVTGEGTDTVQATSDYSIASLANLENITLTGASAVNATGNSAANALTGNSGNNILDGGAGNDSLSGGVGNDALIGGVGNDSLNGGDGTDTADYSAATGAVNVNLTSGTASGALGKDTLTAIENATGGAAADSLTGNSGNNSLSSGGGNDSLNGGSGNDALNGGVGNDALIGGIGNDSLNGGDGVDTANYASATSALTINLSTGRATGDGTDVLTAIENVTTGSAADALTGDGNANTLDSGSGNDIVNGGAGNDSLVGGIGNDALIGGAGNDSLNGGDGVDTADYSTATGTVAINLTAGTATGSLGADTLTAIENATGGAAADSLTGNSANNALNGGAGNDSLNGGLGADALTGQAGADRFAYTALNASLLSGVDRITDLAIGTDVIDGAVAVTAVNLRELGTVSALTQAGVGAVLTTSTFVANGAATFTLGTGTGRRTFLALNDGTAGFSSTTDAVIEITGFTGSLTSLAVV
jgi:Ca2+-binding RTX toxin-like protein